MARKHPTFTVTIECAFDGCERFNSGTGRVLPNGSVAVTMPPGWTVERVGRGCYSPFDEFELGHRCPEHPEERGRGE